MTIAGQFSLDGRIAAQFSTDFTREEDTLIVPISDLSALATSTATTLSWPRSLLGQRISTAISFSSSLVALDLMGSVAIGKIATGETFMVSHVDGGPVGETNDPLVVGDAVFFCYWNGSTTSWYVYKDNVVRLFVGRSHMDALFLVADGNRIVWNECTQPVKQDSGQVWFMRCDLYWSPYTTDPASIQRKLLVPNVPLGLGNAVMQNGYVVANYNYNWPAVPSAIGVIVARVSDGTAWRSILPQAYNWTELQYPAADELWGTITNTPNIGYGQSVVRMPYTSMEVIQTGFPDGGK